ncbi:MAG: hypothetical protein ACOYOB_03695 [Myxococcota bacterium]
MHWTTYLTPRNLAIALVIIVAGWLLFKATKHLIVALLCTLLALGAMVLLLDDKAVDQAKEAAADVQHKAGELKDKAVEYKDKAGELGQPTPPDQRRPDPPPR